MKVDLSWSSVGETEPKLSLLAGWARSKAGSNSALCCTLPTSPSLSVLRLQEEREREQQLRAEQAKEEETIEEQFASWHETELRCWDWGRSSGGIKDARLLQIPFWLGGLEGLELGCAGWLGVPNCQ